MNNILIIMICYRCFLVYVLVRARLFSSCPRSLCHVFLFVHVSEDDDANDYDNDDDAGDDV